MGKEHQLIDVSSCTTDSFYSCKIKHWKRGRDHTKRLKV